MDSKTTKMDDYMKQVPNNYSCPFDEKRMIAKMELIMDSGAKEMKANIKIRTKHKGKSLSGEELEILVLDWDSFELTIEFLKYENGYLESAGGHRIKVKSKWKGITNPQAGLKDQRDLVWKSDGVNYKLPGFWRTKTKFVETDHLEIDGMIPTQSVRTKTGSFLDLQMTQVTVDMRLLTVSGTGVQTEYSSEELPEEQLLYREVKVPEPSDAEKVRKRCDSFADIQDEADDVGPDGVNRCPDAKSIANSCLISIFVFIICRYMT